MTITVATETVEFAVDYAREPTSINSAPWWELSAGFDTERAALDFARREAKAIIGHGNKPPAAYRVRHVEKRIRTVAEVSVDELLGPPAAAEGSQG